MIDITFRNNLYTVTYETSPPEPDIGIYEVQIYDIDVTHLDGEPYEGEPTRAMLEHFEEEIRDSIGS